MREIKKPKYKYSEYNQNVFDKIQDGKYHERQFIKVYDSLFYIEDFTPITVLVYSIIRNQVYITSLHNGDNERSKDKDGDKTTLVGLSTFISNEVFENYGINVRSLYRCLDTLKEYGFISSSTGTNRKNGRLVTLLRDVKEYQPEEIELINKMNRVNQKQKVNMSKSKNVSKNNKNKNQSENKKNKSTIYTAYIKNVNNTDVNSVDEDGEFDDFEF